MPRVTRRVRFYEVRAEDGSRIAEVQDLERHFFDVVASLPPDAPEHWRSDRGLRVRGQVYRPETRATARVPLITIDKVHREPPFRYVRRGEYSDHAFLDDVTEFAEPKFLAFFERNVVASFVSSLRINVAEACLST